MIVTPRMVDDMVVQLELAGYVLPRMAVEAAMFSVFIPVDISSVQVTNAMAECLAERDQKLGRLLAHAEEHGSIHVDVVHDIIGNVP